MSDAIQKRMRNLYFPRPEDERQRKGEGEKERGSE